MSVTVEFGDEREGQPTAQVATNRGWIDVADWADEVGNDANARYPELMQLIDHGASHDLAALIENIDNAVAHDPPDDSTVRKTLKGLRANVMQNETEEYVLVSDGFASGYEDEGDTEEAEAE